MQELFILGPPRTASTSLSSWLEKDDINFVVSNPKEPRYFEFDYDKEKMPEYYLRNFNVGEFGENKIVVNANPINIVVDYVRPRIKESIKNPKFVITLRNPYERAYSDWHNWYTMRPGRSFETFNKGITENFKTFSRRKFQYEHEHVPFCDRKGGSYIPLFIECSLYHNLASEFLKDFGRENILFLDFNNLTENPRNELLKLYSFLGISPDMNFMNHTKFNPKNMRGGKPVSGKKKMDSILKEVCDANFIKLNNIFYKDCENLDSLLKTNYKEKWFGDLI